MIRHLKLMAAAAVLALSQEDALAQAGPLDRGQQSIVAIAALTAIGDIDRLEPALAAGLDAGLTVNETREVLVQMYAYAGFPRSLNGINALMAVIDARKAKGIVDPPGRDATPLPADMDKDAYGAAVRAKLMGQAQIPPPAGYQLFAPVIDGFLKQHLFADIFARDVLNHQQRELATIAALAAMTGTEAQLRTHLKAAMNTGLSRAQLDAYAAVLAEAVGSDAAARATQALAAVTEPKED